MKFWPKIIVYNKTTERRLEEAERKLDLARESFDAITVFMKSMNTDHDRLTKRVAFLEDGRTGQLTDAVERIRELEDEIDGMSDLMQE